MKELRSLFLAAAVLIAPCLAVAKNDSNAVDTSDIDTTTQIQPDSNLEEVLNVPSAAPLGPL